MSCFVIGLEKPKKCKNCRIFNYERCYCPLQGIQHLYTIPLQEIYDNCPLVELPKKHGRLIDADALYNKLKRFYDMFEGATYIGDKARRDELSNVLSELKCNAPTIVNAEE